MKKSGAAGRKTYVPPPQRVLTTPERIKNIRSIVCMGLPEAWCDRDVLKGHFGKFGRITRTTINPAKGTATIHFTEHKIALAAKTNGSKGLPEDVKIFWSQSVATRKLSTSSPPEASRVLKLDSPKKAASSSSSAPQDPELQEELRSMGQTQEYVLPNREQPGALQQTRLEAFFRAPASPERSKKSSEVLKPSTLSSRLAPASTVVRAATSAPVTTASTSSLSSATLSSLYDAISKPALSVPDRLAVLEARDKLLRHRETRSTDIASAKATVGTCPDMCPEKERYLREDRHQVSGYEQNQVGNGMKHNLAVKQYSRSSADQELPLPHELRPAGVLRATMNHLMSHIVPRVTMPDESLGEWYLFLWDRTRAIRKDITQQELCDLDAVTLVEQCARYHIACSALLASEDLTVFDDKINTENLTKCLQTLKHLYQDMALGGMACPNEPEFRAYVALLNLNTGDAMWEVQQLSPEVRGSRQVQLAVQIYLALSHNNYVRFFRLVRQGGFLVAAILMRYFTQARAVALDILTRALCSTSKSAIQFPLDELVRQLGFESAEDAANFCERFGLDASVESGAVSLSRLCFANPASIPPVRRAPLLVESQLRVSLSEVIAGCSLQEISAAPPEPISSFDSATGLLTTQARAPLGVQERTRPAVAAFAPAATSMFAQTSAAPAFSQPVFGAQPASSSSQGLSVFSQAPSIFSTQGRSIFPAPSTAVFSQTPAFAKSTSVFGQSSQQPSFSQPIFGQATSSVGGFKFDLAAPQPAPQPVPSPHESLLKSLTNKVLQRLTQSIVEKTVQEEAQGVAKDWKIAVIARQAGNACILQTLGAMLRETCSAELQAAQQESRARKLALAEQERKERERQELVERVSVKALEMLLSEVVAETMYTNVSEEMERQEQILRQAGKTQASIVMEVVDRQLRGIAQEEIIEARRKWTEAKKALFQRLQMNRVRRVLLRWREKALRARRQWERICAFPPAAASSLNTEEQASELNVHRHLPVPAYPPPASARKGPVRKNVAVQSYPLVEMSAVASQLRSEIQFSVPAFLLGADSHAAPPTWRTTISLPPNQLPLRRWIRQCVMKKSHTSRSCEVYSSCGMLLRFDISEGSESSEAPPHAVVLVVKSGAEGEAAARLRRLMEGPLPPYAPLPVALLLLGGEPGSGVSSKICDALQRLGERGALHHVRSFNLPALPNSQHELERALKWLAMKSCGNLTPLISTPLPCVITSLLRVNVWQPIVMSALPSVQVGAALDKLQQSPNTCLQLANAQLEALAVLIEESVDGPRDEEIGQLVVACPGMPTYWSTSRFRDYLAKVVRCRKFPLLNLPEPSEGGEPVDWPVVLDALKQFCTELRPDPRQADTMLSWATQQILAVSSDFSHPDELPWPRIIESLLQEEICTFNFTDPFAPGTRPLIAVLPRAQLSGLLVASWCSPRTLQMIAALVPAPKPPTPSPAPQSRKRQVESVSDKLDRLLQGLQQVKTKFSKFDELTKDFVI